VPSGPDPLAPIPAAAYRKAPPRSWLERLLRVVLAVGFLLFFAPPIQCLALRWLDPPVTTTMLSRVFAHLWQEVELAWPAHEAIAVRALPRPVAAAAIASEDRTFFRHHGFDVPAIRRAWRHYRSGAGKLVGGSTISQQVARNVFLWQERSWLRKGLEAWYTVWLEALVPKERILEVYLNVAEMGPMVFGIEAAAQHWYGKPAAKLRGPEAARIVAILPAPNRWTPKSPVAARRAAWIGQNPVRVPW